MQANCSSSAAADLYVYGAIYIANNDLANVLCLGRSYLIPDPVLYYVRIAILPAIAGVGFILNLVNVVVLFTPAARIIPSATYLIGISISGTLWMLSSIWLSTIVRAKDMGSGNSFNHIWTHTAIPCTIVFSATFKCSIWFVMAFNMERYLLICRPLKAPRWCTQRRARIISIVIVITSILLSLESPVLQEILPCERFISGESTAMRGKYYLHRRDALAATTAEKVVFSITMATCYVIPIIILLCVNISLIKTVKKAYRDQLERGISGESGTEAHKILLAILITFLFCITPLIPAKTSYFFALRHTELMHQRPLRYFWALADVLYFLFAALNLAIYFLASARYRTLLRQVLCTAPCGNRKDKEYTSGKRSASRGSNLSASLLVACGSKYLQDEV